MAKARTSKPRRRPHRPAILEVRVMSPRIAWFGFLRFLGGSLKFACILAVVAGIGWGLWQGLQAALFKNPDFRLQVLDLNPNPVIDGNDLLALAGIHPDDSLFQIDLDDLTTRLKDLPAVKSVHAERHLPGSLVVKLEARTPRAWIACPDAGLPAERKAGALLVDADKVAYPCPELQLEEAAHLPIIELPPLEGQPLAAGKPVAQPELEHCFRLLDSAIEADPAAAQWIRSIRQINEWSLLLTTRDGIEATFGRGDHARQIECLRAAMDHASRQGYAIGTINLIPRHNVPLTLRSEAPAPRAAPVPEPTAADLRDERRTRDFNQLLNRN